MHLLDIISWFLWEKRLGERARRANAARRRQSETVIITTLQNQEFRFPSNEKTLSSAAGDNLDLRPLPEQRPRALTTADPFHHQQQSPLLVRLPVDVRLVIWEFVLGSEAPYNTIHLETVDGNLRSRRCFEDAADEKLGFRHECWEFPWFRCHGEYPACSEHVCTDLNDVRKLRSLLLTCKAM